MLLPTMEILIGYFVSVILLPWICRKLYVRNLSKFVWGVEIDI